MNYTAEIFYTMMGKYLNHKMQCTKIYIFLKKEQSVGSLIFFLIMSVVPL